MAWSLETPWAGPAVSLDCAPTAGSTEGSGIQMPKQENMNPAKLITLSQDTTQADLAAEAMTDPDGEAGRSSGCWVSVPCSLAHLDPSFLKRVQAQIK